MTMQKPGLTHPELRRLFQIWLDRSGPQGVTLAADLEPEDLRPWITSIVVLDVVDKGQLTYSYYGRALTEAFGTSRLGQSLTRLPAEQRTILNAEYDHVRSSRQPVARIYTADFDGTVQTWERLVLPLSTDGETIDKLLVAAYEL